MSALLFDIGNTRIKWGVADDDGIHKTGHVMQQKLRDTGLVALTRRLPARVDTVLASNTAGATFATRLAGVVHAHCGCDVHFAKPKKSAYGLQNAYAQPRRLGVDRWVAMVGAWGASEEAFVLVDAGTAVTIDVVDDDGRHRGGQILPGVRLMAAALAKDTSDLPLVPPAKPARFEGMAQFGANTRAAIGAGALAAVAGAVERAIRTLRSNAYEPRLVLTGGDASRILGALDEPAEHRPNLVLEGLHQMLKADAANA